MKNVLGFVARGETERPGAPAAAAKEAEPVRSLASVRFQGEGRALTYYNDRFRLEVGDRVFVSGCLAGKPGTVEKVTTRFRIAPADYQRVIARARGALRGTFEAVLDKMICYDRLSMTPEEFRSWILPPEGEEKELVVGDGYSLDLSAMEEAEDFSRPVMERAQEYCSRGKVAYLSVTGGVGTAFVEGTEWYRVDFRLDGEKMTEMYCDCPYPGLCKHLLAAALTLRALKKELADPERDFVALDRSRFWTMAARTAKRVALDVRDDRARKGSAT